MLTKFADSLAGGRAYDGPPMVVHGHVSKAAVAVRRGIE
ncbi:hypothetical protein WA016_05386 [Myxococcus stipitatus]